MGKKDNSKGAKGGKTKGKDVVVTIEIEFMDAINGTTKNVTYAKTSKCGTC